MTNEEKILFLSAKINFTLQDEYKIKQLLCHDIDWFEFVESAISCGVLAVSINNILKINDNSIPKQDLEKIADDQKIKYVSNNIALWNEFKKVIKIADESDIPVMPIKGIMLDPVLYASAGLRWTTDIDILIKKEHLLKMESVLTSLGFKLAQECANDRDFFINQHYHLAFEKEHVAEKPLKIDVHWDILPVQLKINGLTDDFWANSGTKEILGQKLLIPSIEDIFLECAVELFKDHINHRYFILKRQLDISQTIYLFGSKIDWDKFIKRIYKYKLNNWIYYALISNNEILNNKTISKEILIRLKPSFYKKIFIPIIIKISRIKKLPRLKELFYIAGLTILFRNWKGFFIRFFGWLFKKNRLSNG